MFNEAVQTLQPVERETRWDYVYAQLRDALFAGRFEPGSRLVLRDLAELLGASITPVRDTVALLVANGTLEQGPATRRWCPMLGPSSLGHLIIVRSELEGAPRVRRPSMPMSPAWRWRTNSWSRCAR